MLKSLGDRKERDVNQRHREEQSPPLPRIAHHPAKRVAYRRGEHYDGQHLKEVRKWGGVLEWGSRVCVEEPAAVRTELLDRDLRCGRAHGDVLLRYLDGFRFRLALGVEDRLAVR